MAALEGRQARLEEGTTMLPVEEQACEVATETTVDNPTVIRTERGLTIAGTRITLYLVMDYIKAEWPPRLIQHWLDLTDTQIAGVMEYIDRHRDEDEAEYQIVLRQ